MIVKFLLCSVFLVLLAGAGQAQNLTNWELCEAIYREYGMRTEACDRSAEAPAKDKPAKDNAPAPSAQADLNDETRESHVFFAQGGAQLSEAAQKQVADVVAVLETGPLQKACIKLVGHSDSSGAAEANKKLSQARAQAVADAMATKLSDGARIQNVTGAGEDEMLPGLSPASPYQRRVAIWARDCQ